LDIVTGTSAPSAQDFSDGILTNVPARFACRHPSVLVEVKTDRNAVLREMLSRKQLDFVL
jgi:DNA-binding transcriptional LysR family regulator